MSVCISLPIAQLYDISRVCQSLNYSEEIMSLIVHSDIPIETGVNH